MAQENRAPELFNAQDVYRGAYAARLEAFAESGRRAELPEQDGKRVALILVDYQHDFVDPSGSLYVPGALEDISRLLSWFYRNGHRIGTIYASLDTHLPRQIFFGSWWVNAKGEHPQPYTTISSEEVERGDWRLVREVEWSLSYVRQLQKQARKDLMIWPFHTMEGTLGHMLAAPISEAIAWHSAARQTQPRYIVKGLTERSEYYGIFGAEIPDPEDPESRLNTALLEEFLQYERIYIAGEAKSHCVLESERQLVNYLRERPEQLRKLYFLRDCTSSVKHPSIDFDAQAERELGEMERLGVQMVQSSSEM
jgi:nicotinamidase/pyrazinamidase